MLARGVSEDIVASPVKGRIAPVDARSEDGQAAKLPLQASTKPPKTEAPGLHRRVGARVPSVDGLDGRADGCT